jgi:hypothetical protein
MLLPQTYTFTVYPNPFNASSMVEFSLPNTMKVSLAVFNLLGERVATLVDGRLASGAHRIAFDGSRLASGVYVYRLAGENFAESKKMVLLK